MNDDDQMLELELVVDDKKRDFMDIYLSINKTLDDLLEKIKMRKLKK